MTRTQGRLYAYLLRSAGENVQPSIAEMALHLAGKCSTSPASIHRMLLVLQGEGLVERLPGQVRCWRAVRQNPLEAYTVEQLEKELMNRGFYVTLERKKEGWTVCPDCGGDRPNLPGNIPGCQTCENEGGWAS